MESYCRTINSPLGKLRLTASETALTGVFFNAQGVSNDSNLVLEQASRWLADYFAGKVVEPSLLPLAPAGTVFQQKVWDILLEIPYGTTVTYGEIAERISPTMSAQAVGNAVGANRLPIIIPCHRVVAANGIGGFSDGLAIKRQLLAIEGITLPL